MELKQAIVINSDLAMSAGKMAAQACHAAVGAVDKASPRIVAQWNELFGMTKIVLRANEEILLECYAKARKAGLPCYLVADAGRTEIAPGSITALAIGPGEIDSITGNLPLY